VTTLYLPPSLRGMTTQYMTFSTWVDHVPFGHDLVAALRPRLLVELGTQRGLSYFTFCQAMKENGIDGLAYAVDTFEGDAHTGVDEKSLFEEVNRYNRQNYNGFSYLMRMLFQDAAAHFEADTIDLLHIDGLHTEEAVTEDFTTWYPKVRPGGIILFHDVRARLLDFGTWRFWDAVEKTHETFVFNHGFGLGVLRKLGGDRSRDSELVKLMFDSPGPDAAERLRSFYVHASRYHELSRQAAAAARRAQTQRDKALQKKDDRKQA
jgi:hypothetical protein